MNPEDIAALVKWSTVPGVEIKDLAVKFNVSIKTVSRILKGETWSSVSGIQKEEPVERKPVVSPLYPVGVEEALKIQRSLTQSLRVIRPYFGFDPARPLYWGRYEAWDGLCHVATDGIIAWHCEQLCTFVEKLQENGFSEVAELPSFGLATLMDCAVGDAVPLPEATKHACCTHVKIASKTVLNGYYATLAQQRRLEVRKPLGDSRFVYFTKARSQRSAPTFSVVHAAVALCLL